jgi:hypothetical protein
MSAEDMIAVVDKMLPGKEDPLRAAKRKAKPIIANPKAEILEKKSTQKLEIMPKHDHDHDLF